MQLADALVEFETLDAEEVKKVIRGERIRTVEERLQDAMSHVQQDEERHTNPEDPGVLEHGHGQAPMPPQTLVS